MRLIRILAVFLLISSLSSYGQREAQTNIEFLRSQVQRGNVTKVEILRIPDDVMTRTTVTQDWMRKGSYYTVTFTQDIGTIFSPLLSDSSTKNNSQQSNLRWGVLFFDSNGREIGSIFVDHFGEKGYVDGQAVAFGLNLAKPLPHIIRDLR